MHVDVWVNKNLIDKIVQRLNIHCLSFLFFDSATIKTGDELYDEYDD